MSLRSQFPAARPSASHYFLTITRGDRARQVAFRPWVLWTAGVFTPFALVGFVGASAWMMFRDDVLVSMLRRQTEMQYAYEDRLAAMRGQLDRVTSRQLLDQDTLEGRVHEIISRQAQIENRATIIAMLADQAGVARDATATIPRPEPRVAAPHQAVKPPQGRTTNPLLTQRQVAGPLPAGPLPAGVSAFAPVAPPAAQPALKPLSEEKPRPEIPETRADLGAARALAGAANPDVPVELRLRAVMSSIEKQEFSQVRTVAAIGGAARQTVARLRNAIAETGLSPERLNPPASDSRDRPMGGPFVPLKADPNGSLFEKEVYRLQGDFTTADRLRRVVPGLPVRKPLEGPLDVTSPFGGRPDPFFGRLATHTGLDLREPDGSPVRATAAGKIVSAGWNGGYGNMIEIDHGNGLATRYAHLSAVLVSEDQSVAAGAIVGRLGSTGRSTGPHLHYEVRVNGDPVDPQRFLRAGSRVLAGG